MPQYQSFPDAAGDSVSLEKLKALRLPPLAGRSFLDVGCNEGYFCGFALFAGASKVVGLDASELFIERARRRFTQASFECQSWDNLPDAPFDVVLLASALHYAEDQAALLSRLVGALSDNGVLVLELGIAPGETNEWCEVERGIDSRWFPTWPTLLEILRPYEWKDIGPSVNQRGDPIPRRVIHVCRRRPVAYLLAQPPGYGKSSLCRKVFIPAGIRVVENDYCLCRIASGEACGSPALQAVVASHFYADALDRTLAKVIEATLLDDLVQVWLTQANGLDFALDGYLPQAVHEAVREQLSAGGYMVVALHWDPPQGKGVPPLHDAMGWANAYEVSLLKQGHANEPASALPALPFTGIHGHVDRVRCTRGRLHVWGWAVHHSSVAPTNFFVTLGGQEAKVISHERVPRVDVQHHLQLPHPYFGYLLEVERPADIGVEQLPTAIAVHCSVGCESVFGPLWISPDAEFIDAS